MRYALIYLLALDYLVGLWLGGAWPLLVPLLVFALIPSLDVLIGVDEGAPTGRGPLHEPLVRAWMPLQLAILAISVWVVRDWALAPAILLTVALGIVTGGGGINVAHELIHRRSRLDRTLGEVLMTSVSYPWFCVEHVLGHHRRVATPEDPATARYGESVFAFLPRSVFGGFRSFARLEQERTQRRSIRWWSLADRRTRYLLTTTATWLAVAGVGGWPGLLLFAGQSVTAVLLLEVINYVEHYGLVRKESRPADAASQVQYARVAPEHSWNSNHRLTAAFLFNLPRHADHHAHASRPYYDLRAWPNAPELPSGYAAMVLLALVPALWFRVMNPRVRALSAIDGATVGPSTLADG